MPDCAHCNRPLGWTNPRTSKGCRACDNRGVEIEDAEERIQLYGFLEDTQDA